MCCPDQGFKYKSQSSEARCSVTMLVEAIPISPEAREEMLMSDGCKMEAQRRGRCDPLPLGPFVVSLLRKATLSLHQLVVVINKVATFGFRCL